MDQTTTTQGNTQTNTPQAIASSYLNPKVGLSDLYKKRNELDKSVTDKRNALNTSLNSIAQYFAPSMATQKAQQGALKAQSVLRNFDTNQLGIQNDITNQGGGVPQIIANRQASAQSRDAALQRLALSNEETNALARAQIAQGNDEQRLAAAKFLYDAGRNDLNDTISLYKETSPESIGTFTDKTTGDVTLVLQNPFTGETSSQVIAKVSPEKNTQIVKLDNGATVLIDADSGDVIRDFGGIKPAEGSVSGDNVDGLAGLSSKVQTSVIKEADKFGNTPIVKKYNEIVSAANFINATDPNSQNAASHQALIYNFAKMLDPDSVVREGEYETVKKYSQSLISKFGGEIKQALSGNGFLSANAIRAIQEESQNRVDAYAPQYESLKKQYGSRINNIAGGDIADNVLLNYEEGYKKPETKPDDVFDQVVGSGGGYWSRLWGAITGN